ncbi:MAG: membrane dipeptidase [Sphingobacteriales bacterium]|nr:membrane dipeptidase [Sphingobacteriales bacterium]
MKMFTIDIHCHPNLKSFNSGHPEPAANMWDSIQHKIDGKVAQSISELVTHIHMESQCNLDAMAAGNVRVFQLSLYPTERGFLHLRNIPKILVGKRRINIAQEVITGYAASSIAFQKKQYNYFEDLLAEYEYVKNQQGKSPDGKSEFVLVNNYKELEQALKMENTLIGIVTIEGAHVLGTGAPTTDQIPKDALIKQMTENIRTIKNWEYPPFVINLAHHFWNHLCGHATSFKRPINGLVNQNKGKNKGITEAGWHVIRELLSANNGKRILIDTKHMSVAARKEYYAFIGNHNYLNPKHKIPVISSHACASGFKTLDSSIRQNDIMVKARKARLYKWSINISDEEARIIHDSEGLIGLMMDKGNLGGLDLIKAIGEIPDAEKKRREFAQLFLDNAFQLVKAVGKKSGWDMIAIRTDFDGTITHIDPYESASKMPLLLHDLLDYLEKNKYQKELWYGYTPVQIIEKVFYKNAMDFYKKFFV